LPTVGEEERPTAPERKKKKGLESLKRGAVKVGQKGVSANHKGKGFCQKEHLPVRTAKGERGRGRAGGRKQERPHKSKGGPRRRPYHQKVSPEEKGEKSLTKKKEKKKNVPRKKKTEELFSQREKGGKTFWAKKKDAKRKAPGQ